jgi:hypothetical protein
MNLLGFTATASGTLPNRIGVQLRGNGVMNTILGAETLPLGANAIAATDAGVWLRMGTLSGPRATHIRGNLIRGAVYGVLAENHVGGDVTGNVISANGTGVAVQAGSLAVGANSIFANAGLGIDLGPQGVTPNDAGDADAGANALQNFPVLASARSVGGVTTIQGTLASAAGGTFTVDIYESAVADASGYGEGEIHRGSLTMTTNASGVASFAAVIPAPIAPGRVITATATDATGNTSEFSAAVPVTN